MDNIYGTMNPDGSVATWPETDIYGRPYNRPPAGTHRVGNRFVVLPAGFNDPEALSRLQGPRPVSPLVSKSDDEQAPRPNPRVVKSDDEQE